jgi:stage V sporulation protein SpoVS
MIIIQKKKECIIVHVKTGVTKVFRVGKNTTIGSLRKALMSSLEKDRTVFVDSIGMTSTYVAIKAIILVHGEMASRGFKIESVPTFLTITINGEQPVTKTGIRYVLKATYCGNAY